MATKLKKPIRREMILFTDNRTIARTQDRVTVSIYPESKLIGFRRHRKRKEYLLPLESVLLAAIKGGAYRDGIEAAKLEKLCGNDNEG